MNESQNERLPFVSIIIPMRNEKKYIGKCLQSVINQDYPRSLVEILVVDGGSTDGSIEIVEKLAKRYPNIKLLGGPGMNCPAAMNIGIKDAKGEIICKVDAHGYVASDFLKMGIKYLYRDENIKCVGGPIRPLGGSFVTKANILARASVYGVGGGVNTLGERSQFVDTVQCGIYERQVFDEVGLFDESLQFGEDEEINWRIRKAAYKIYFTPEVKFFYYPRNSFASLFEQYYNYGAARIKVIRKHPDFFRFKHIVPSVFLLSLLASIVLSPFHRSFFWLFLAIATSYLLSSLTFSLLISKREGWQYFVALPISFISLHFGYGWGFLRGVFKLRKIGG